MHINKGNFSKKAEYSFKLIYFQSDAVDPPDKLIINSKEYIITPGLEVEIRKGDVYKIISTDPNSYRIYNRVKLFDLSSVFSHIGTLSLVHSNGNFKSF